MKTLYLVICILLYLKEIEQSTKATTTEEDEEEEDEETSSTKKLTLTTTVATSKLATALQITREVTVPVLSSSNMFHSNRTLKSPSRNTVLFEACGKRYLAATLNKFAMGDMHSLCCMYGMTSIQIETVEELKCLDKKYKEVFNSSTEFWTYASSYQCPGHPVWCTWAEKKMQQSIDLSLWIKGEPASYAAKACVGLRLSPGNSSSGLFKFECVFKKYFALCESNKADSETSANETESNGATEVTHEVNNFTELKKKPKIAENGTQFNCLPVCLYLTCVTTMKTSKFFSPNGTLIGDPKKMRYLDACGSKYVFILKSKDIQAKDCCEFGMRFLVIETKEELACLETNYKEMYNVSRSFWTRGSDAMCPGNYMWCHDKRDATMIPFDKKLWRPGEPGQASSSYQNCYGVELNPNGGSGVFKAKCFENRFNLLCEIPNYGQQMMENKLYNEGQLQTTRGTQGCKVQCTPHTCINFNTKEVNDSVALKNRNVTIFEACGKKYAHIPAKTSVKENLCCSMGMQRLRITSDSDLQCLDKKFKEIFNASTATWTRGVDTAECSVSHVWCGNNLSDPLAAVDTQLWRPREPSRNESLQCMALELHPRGGPRPALLKIDCTKEKLADLCEKSLRAVEEDEEEEEDDDETTKTANTTTPATTSTTMRMTVTEESEEEDEDVKVKTNSSRITTTPEPKCVGLHRRSVYMEFNCPIKKMKDSKKFTADGKLIDKSKNVVLKRDTCGRNILFVFEKRMFNTMKPFCCDYGMDPFVIESLDVMKCLNETLQDFPQKKDEFCVCANDATCPSIYRWCRNQKIVAQEMWLKKDQPIGMGCVLLELGSKKIGLTAKSFIGTYNFLCEELK